MLGEVYALSEALDSGALHITGNYPFEPQVKISFDDGLQHIRKELQRVLANLSKFAEQYKNVPTLGYTHFQPAQLVTVGKRATLWMQDFLMDLDEIDAYIEQQGLTIDKTK